jgi:hypothetical protein
MLYRVHEIAVNRFRRVLSLAPVQLAPYNRGNASEGRKEQTEKQPHIFLNDFRCMLKQFTH